METNYNPHSPWPQRDDELRKHCAWRGPNGEVMSGGDVANRMGLRKGQVIGRARRLNVEIGVLRSDAKAPPETRQERRQRDLIKANDARLANAVEAVKRRGSFGSLPIKLATPITFQIWREKPKPERIHRAPMPHMSIPTHAVVITPEALLLPPIAVDRLTAYAWGAEKGIVTGSLDLEAVNLKRLQFKLRPFEIEHVSRRVGQAERPEG